MPITLFGFRLWTRPICNHTATAMSPALIDTVPRWRAAAAKHSRLPRSSPPRERLDSERSGSRSSPPRLRACAVALVASMFATSAGAQSPGDVPAVRLLFQQRSRYQVIDDSPRTNTSASDQALELQTSMFIEAGRGNVRFNGEIMDARVELNDAQSFLSTTLIDTLEPLQANVTWNFSGLLGAGHTGSLKVGRFTTDVGKRRFGITIP